MKKRSKKRSKKEVKKEVKKKQDFNFYLTVYYYIKQSLNPAQICKKLNISKQRLNYYLKTLKNKEMIKKVGYGAWEIKEVKTFPLPPRPKFIKDFNVKAEIRSHAFMFKLEIPKIKGWENREKYFLKKGISFKRIKKLNLFVQRIIINGKYIHLHEKSIIVYDNDSYVANLSTESLNMAINEFLEVVKSLERMLKISFKINNRYKYQVIRQHHSIMKNALAKNLNKKKKKLSLTDHLGEWGKIDNSLNINEFETIRANESEFDSIGMQNYFNSHKRTGYIFTPEFILNELMPLLSEIGTNLKEHLKAIKGINKGIANYGTSIKEFNLNIKQKRLTRWFK